MVVTAAEWRRMGLSGILESLETALNVIEKEEVLPFKVFRELLDSVTRIVQILNDHVDQVEKLLIEAFIDDLEEIKTLLEEYNLGKRLLADVWDYINARLEVYMEEK
jgi:predicted RNA-binding protein with EMAP domain